MNALNYFLSDLAGILSVVIIAIVAIVLSAKSSFKRHDIIVAHLKKNGSTLIEKEWYTIEDNVDHIHTTAYVIKYLDKDKRLHMAWLEANESTGEITISKDKLIDS